MAQNGRFGLSLRLLVLLAQNPEKMLTSEHVGAALKTSPVMVRRVFPALHTAGFIVQRKGPQGGVRLKVQPKAIGLGDVYAAVSSDWPPTSDKPVNAALKRLHQDAVQAMNETTVASLLKRIRKSAAQPPALT